MMNYYTANFFSTTGSGWRKFKARTAEQAMQKARAWHARYGHELEIDEFEAELTEIVLQDEGERTVARWMTDDLRLFRASRDLLEALEELVERERGEAAASGFTDDEMTWLEDARRAIAKAKGGAS